MENKYQPAFPDTMRASAHGTNSMDPIEFPTGLTKREYFAAMAMQGLMAVNDKGKELRNWDMAVREAAKISVMMADALLTELEKH